MDLSVILPRLGRADGFDATELVRQLEATDLHWELQLVLDDPRRFAHEVPAHLAQHERVHRIEGTRSELAFRTALASAAGELILVVDPSTASVSAFPEILAELRRRPRPDLVISTRERPNGEAQSWSDGIRDRAYRLALRHGGGRSRVPTGIYGVRRGALQEIAVDGWPGHPLQILGRAVDLELEVRERPLGDRAGRAPRRPRGLLSFLVSRRPALTSATLGVVALIVGLIGASVGGFNWAKDPETAYCGATVGLGIVAMAGAQLTLFSFIVDRHQGMRGARRRRRRSTFTS